MWPKFLKSKWFERLFTATLSVMLLLLTQRLTVIRENSNREYEERKRIEIELSTKASIPYVDSKDKELEVKIDKSKSESVERMKEYVDKTSEDIHEIRNILYKIIKLSADKRTLRNDTSTINSIEMDTEEQLRKAICLLRERASLGKDM